MSQVSGTLKPVTIMVEGEKLQLATFYCIRHRTMIARNRSSVKNENQDGIASTDEFQSSSGNSSRRHTRW